MANTYSTNLQLPTPAPADTGWWDELDLCRYMQEFMAVAQASENRAISGLVVSDGGGLNADYTTGVADVGGSRHNVSGSSIALTASSENFIYVNSSGVVTKSTTIPGAIDYTPIARVDTDGSGVLRVADCRIFGKPSLRLENGVEIDEFSSDGTMAGDSDTACPTEGAVVQYVQENIAPRNILDNGEMLVAQRGNFASGVTTTGYYTVDRHKCLLNAAGTWSLSQPAFAPPGFFYSYKHDCTTANASLAAGAYLTIKQSFTGQNLAALNKGLASAKKLQLGFWVYSPKTGTYIVNLNDTDNTRSVSKAYTVNSASTWEYKEIEFPADTTGELTEDSAESLNINFWLAAGTDFTSGTLATSWETSTNANKAVGQVNLADSTSNTFFITGINLVPGDYLPDKYPYKSYQEYLEICQRHYRLFGTCYFNRVPLGGASNDGAITIYHSPEMRATPTVTAGSLSYGSGLSTTQNTNKQLRMRCTATDAVNEPYIASLALSAEM